MDGRSFLTILICHSYFLSQNEVMGAKRLGGKRPGVCGGGGGGGGVKRLGEETVWEQNDPEPNLQARWEQVSLAFLHKAHIVHLFSHRKGEVGAAG